MGQQTNKTEKLKRRLSQIKRKKVRAKELKKAVKPSN